MKALLIDPKEKKVSEVEIPGPDGDDYGEQLKAMRGLIGCDCVSTAHYFHNNNDVVFSDDEALLRPDVPEMFRIGLDAGVIPGKGIVLGGDGQGGSVDVKTTVGQLSSLIYWVVPLRKNDRTVFIDIKANL